MICPIQNAEAAESTGLLHTVGFSSATGSRTAEAVSIDNGVLERDCSGPGIPGEEADEGKNDPNMPTIDVTLGVRGVGGGRTLSRLAKSTASWTLAFNDASSSARTRSA